MSNLPRRSPQIKKLARPLIATGLITSGLFQLVPPALSLGTTAGTNIENRATATYNDPANPTVPLNATSNSVTATVAEVAGLNVAPAGIVDNNAGSINSNDLVYFDFLVTNIGNAPTNINVPLASITNADGNLTIAGFQIDLNNDGDFADPGEGTITLTDTNSDGDFADPGEITGILTADQVATAIAADASIRVRVVTTVDPALGAGAPVAIQLGNTGTPAPNAVTPGSQNQVYDNDATINDVFTSGGAPTNGQREAAALQSSAVSLAVKPLALATVFKTRSVYNPNTAASLTDDTITYRLDFEVEASSPDPTFTPTNLEGTTIRLSPNADGSAPVDVTRILVADAIPQFTTLTGAPITPPAGWTVVYSTSPLATRVVGGAADSATVWQTTPPASLASVTRIGWIFNGTLAPGTTTVGDANGFQFNVVTSGLASTGDTIANIAQAFGETVGDPTNEVIYDESGDPNPNNFNDDGTPPDTTGTNYVPATDTGVANPATQGTDNNNDNSGTGEKGETNILPIVPQGSILNGPLNVPGAIGPTSNQDDFVNKSSLAIEGGGTHNAEPGSTFNPAPVTFDNTFQNPPSNATDLDTVRLLPLAPNNGSVPAASQQNATDIPDNTIVTISAAGSSAQYSYASGTGYTYVPASGTGANFDSTSNTLRFDNVNPGVSIDYTVTINLPTGIAGATLSADRFLANGAARAGYSVPVVAFVDNNNSGGFDALDNVFNIKIDRLYLGHLSLLKQQRILDTNGTTVIQDWTTADVTSASGFLQPGRFIEYRIAYVNFSTPSAGSGNVTLGISNLVITDDGTTGTFVAGGNGTPSNWALPLTTPVTTHQQNTTATAGTLQFFNGATNLGSVDPSSGSIVTRYVNNVGTLSPDTAVTPADATTYQGNMTFRRLLN